MRRPERPPGQIPRGLRRALPPLGDGRAAPGAARQEAASATQESKDGSGDTTRRWRPSGAVTLRESRERRARSADVRPRPPREPPRGHRRPLRRACRRGRTEPHHPHRDAGCRGDRHDGGGHLPPWADRAGVRPGLGGERASGPRDRGHRLEAGPGPAHRPGRPRLRGGACPHPGHARRRRQGGRSRRRGPRGAAPGGRRPEDEEDRADGQGRRAGLAADGGGDSARRGS